MCYGDVQVWGRQRKIDVRVATERVVAQPVV
jgi:hypothetical protein